ncbi:GNAT family N-acetyltransferase [Actinoplanes sp. NPDC051470]|uniref:GNAT family N-acetyltransferase n=1 Tax=Actinoplanes sp. NPDC051470 TaxID=3157224 RepID=UPI003419A7ED
MAATLSLTHYGPAQLDSERKTLLDVYEDVYADRLNDPFFSTDRYWQRLEGYASRDGFAFVVGTIDTEPIGYALGYTLPAGSGWWNELKSDAKEKDLIEDGRRTFALTEIMVSESRRRRGYARQLHDQLLADRDEERATLLVLPENAAAQAAYASWGWRKLGEIKPFDDSPTYDAMLLTLK